ncbi:hypothetical protein G6F35_008992 [Rhizopus arrhizus]|nr:hypothetical protein G6F35_008992 [Rhizopus arrhizus]
MRGQWEPLAAPIVFLQLFLERDVRRRTRHRGLVLHVRVGQATATTGLQDRDHAGDLRAGARQRNLHRLDALAHPLGEQRFLRHPVLVERGRRVVVRRPLQPGAGLGDTLLGPAIVGTARCAPFGVPVALLPRHPHAAIGIEQTAALAGSTGLVCATARTVAVAAGGTPVIALGRRGPIARVGCWARAGLGRCGTGCRRARCRAAGLRRAAAGRRRSSCRGGTATRSEEPTSGLQSQTLSGGGGLGL